MTQEGCVHEWMQVENVLGCCNGCHRRLLHRSQHRYPHLSCSPRLSPDLRRRSQLLSLPNFVFYVAAVRQVRTDGQSDCNSVNASKTSSRPLNQPAWSTSGLNLSMPFYCPFCGCSEYKCHTRRPDTQNALGQFAASVKFLEGRVSSTTCIGLRTRRS